MIDAVVCLHVINKDHSNPQQLENSLIRFLSLSGSKGKMISQKYPLI